MGKYRTCGKSNAHGGSDCKSEKIVHRSVINSQNNNNGNSGGKFLHQGNVINNSPPQQGHKNCTPLVTKRPSHHHTRHPRSSLVLLYAFALAISIIFSFSQQFLLHAQAQPIQGQGEDQGQPKEQVNQSSSTAASTPTRKDDDHDLAHPNCSRSSAEDFPPDIFSLGARRSGAILIHFLVSIYLFYALLLVCDEYFVPAVESICKELRIPSDVAGATFMAVSTSAPELFTNLIGTFLTSGDLGVGTIVGSAVFNILAVGACCGILTGYSVHKLAKDNVGVRLDWWPLTRDSIFYLASVAALIIILSNRRVYWTEALFMLALYALYVLVLCFNTPIKNVVESILWKVGAWRNGDDGESRRISIVVGKILSMGAENNEKTPLLLSVSEKNIGPDNNNERLKSSQSLVDLSTNKEYDMPTDSLDQVLIQNALSCSESYNTSQPIEECSGCCNWPDLKGLQNWRLWLQWVISWPIRFLLWLTVPDCRVYSWRKWYWGTLGMCVGWIGLLTYIISWMVTIIGETFTIPDSVTGLTFLAAGTSIPEVISSLIVARQGLGSMAFSNTIGSNTFDVLVCLGLPWLIKAATCVNQEIDYVEIHSGGLEYSAVILISALLILYFAIAVNGFVLDRKIGLGCVLMYIIFITFACMLEMNVFFPVNLPPC